MLPAILLNVTPSHAVLDLCAAPGSKTLQLLEAMCANDAGPESGFLVANELDGRRAEALCSRIQTDGGALASRCAVVRCNAAIFPTIFHCDRVWDDLHWGRQLPEPVAAADLKGEELGCGIYYRMVSAKTAVGVATPWYRRRKLKFDRILADVPCSGDGTLRKSPDIWASWSAARGLGNFPRQLAILRRGFELLREGGHIVYSTCSLNPLECEAVVSAAVMLHNATKAQQGGGVVVLEDGHSMLAKKLPGVVAAAFDRGLLQWPVPSPQFSEAKPLLFQTWEDVPLALRSRRSKVRAAEAAADDEVAEVDKQKSKGVKLRREMFPGAGLVGDRPDTSRCVRVLPGPHIDGGGFFVAVISKANRGEQEEACGVAKDIRTESYKLWADCRFAFPRLKPKKREVPAILHFYGLFSDVEEAAARGVNRFPIERLSWMPGAGRAQSQNTSSLGLLPDLALGLQYHSDLAVLGGGLPLFARMDRNCAWARQAGASTSEAGFFSWRPEPGAAASTLCRCCTRRVLRLPRHALRRLLRDRRLPTKELQDADGFETCGRFELRASMAMTGTMSVLPGGVLVLEEGLSSAGFAFAALLSPNELLVLGSADQRDRWLTLLAGDL